MNADATKPTQPIIGFIGLGIIGRPMAGHLLEAGYKLVVLDINPAPVGELVGLGAEAAATPKAVAAQSDVIITMLPDSPDVEMVVLGADGKGSALPGCAGQRRAGGRPERGSFYHGGW